MQHSESCVPIISPKIALSVILITFISVSLPTRSLILSQGLGKVALYDKDILLVSLSILTILNFIFCEKIKLY